MLQTSLHPAAAAFPSPQHEHELKMLLPLDREPVVATWLACHLRPDGAFPQNDLFTLYFDDASLTSLAEKLDGDCAKTKIRLRWYSTPGGEGSTSPVFLEIKQRYGSTRSKKRLPTDLEPRDVFVNPLARGLESAVASRLREAGFHSPGLQASVFLTYRRCRFVEPISQARVALDAAITPLAVRPAVARSIVPGRLPFAVVEVKSPEPQLPRALCVLRALGCQSRALSKYALCLAARG